MERNNNIDESFTNNKNLENNNLTTIKKKRDEYVSNYLNSFLQTDNDNDDNDDNHLASITKRVMCCGKNQSLYCTECFRLFIQPPENDAFSIKLPFDLEILLDDRRNSSTGIHAMVMLGGGSTTSSAAVGDSKQFDKRENYCICKEGGEEEKKKEEESSCSSENYSSLPIQQSLASFAISSQKTDTYCQTQQQKQQNQFHHTSHNNQVTLIDTTRGDTIPPYNNNNNTTTYLLFPSSKSIPLSSVSHEITKLVVLDCKWTKTSLLQKSSVIMSNNIQHVHLSNPPDTSYFWRWHHEGKGMLSTIEAIYYAALEVLDGKKKEIKNERNNNAHHDVKIDHPIQDDDTKKENKEETITNDDEEEAKNLIRLLYLFAIKRFIMSHKAKQENRTIPFSEQGKEEQRVMRHYNATEKLRRKNEEGRRLKEEARLKRLREKKGREEGREGEGLTPKVYNDQ